MNIVIKPLTPELAADYFDFFENRAFTDDSPYRCYCQIFQMSKAESKAASDYATTSGLDGGQIARTIAQQQIESGILKGYLAYVDGVSIGWCNANDRANYPAKQHYAVPFHAPADKQEKAVVCFLISPEYRGRGVASALLQQVINDAKAENYTAVVAFPVKRNERFEWDTQGPIQLYDKTGFVKMEEQDGHMVMKKDFII